MYFSLVGPEVHERIREQHNKKEMTTKDSRQHGHRAVTISKVIALGT